MNAKEYENELRLKEERILDWEEELIDFGLIERHRNKFAWEQYYHY